MSIIKCYIDYKDQLYVEHKLLDMMHKDVFYEIMGYMRKLVLRSNLAASNLADQILRIYFYKETQSVAVHPLQQSVGLLKSFSTKVLENLFGLLADVAEYLQDSAT